MTVAGTMDQIRTRDVPIRRRDRVSGLGWNRAHRRARASTRGRYARRVIRTITRGGRSWELHATKGWRSYRRH